MKLAISLSVLATLAIVGCGPVTSPAPQIDTTENLPMGTPDNERPALDFMGPYNVLESECEWAEFPIWTERSDLEEITLEEFIAVRVAVVQAISKHSTVYSGANFDAEFFVYDDKFFDRTQKVEITASASLPETLPAVVNELQSVLKDYPLWRVMFIGEGYEGQSPETYFVVYPDVVRIDQISGAKTPDEAVRENADARLRFVEERKMHQDQRKADLQEAVVAAISRLEQSSDEVMLVAWYDTLSAIDWDWGWEGKSGASVWLLLRSPIGTDRNAAKSEIFDLNYYWSSEDGEVANEEPELGESFQFLMLEESHKTISNLEVEIQGRAYSFDRPSN